MSNEEEIIEKVSLEVKQAHRELWGHRDLTGGRRQTLTSHSDFGETPFGSVCTYGRV